MAIIVILCGAPHLYKKDMNNSGLEYYLKKIIDENSIDGLIREKESGLSAARYAHYEQVFRILSFHGMTSSRSVVPDSFI